MLILEFWQRIDVPNTPIEPLQGRALLQKKVLSPKEIDITIDGIFDKDSLLEGTITKVYSNETIIDKGAFTAGTRDIANPDDWFFLASGERTLTRTGILKITMGFKGEFHQHALVRGEKTTIDTLTKTFRREKGFFNAANKLHSDDASVVCSSETFQSKKLSSSEFGQFKDGLLFNGTCVRYATDSMTQQSKMIRCTGTFVSYNLQTLNEQIPCSRETFRCDNEFSDASMSCILKEEGTFVDDQLVKGRLYKHPHEPTDIVISIWKGKQNIKGEYHDEEGIYLEQTLRSLNVEFGILHGISTHQSYVVELDQNKCVTAITARVFRSRNGMSPLWCLRRTDNGTQLQLSNFNKQYKEFKADASVDCREKLALLLKVEAELALEGWCIPMVVNVIKPPATLPPADHTQLLRGEWLETHARARQTLLNNELKYRTDIVELGLSFFKTKKETMLEEQKPIFASDSKKAKINRDKAICLHRSNRREQEMEKKYVQQELQSMVTNAVEVAMDKSTMQEYLRGRLTKSIFSVIDKHEAALAAQAVVTSTSSLDTVIVETDQSPVFLYPEPISDWTEGGWQVDNFLQAQKELQENAQRRITAASSLKQ